jgi:hypothetical protein
MPRYHFAVKDAARYDDPDGTEVPDDAGALDYAIRSFGSTARRGAQLEGMDDGGQAGPAHCVADPL